MKILMYAAAAAFTVIGSAGAYAQGCNGRDDTTGTIVGALGGAAIGGVATNNVGGAAIGGVLGGLAGNVISRSQDCERQNGYGQGYYRQQDGRAGYNGSYQQGYGQQADENDYWGVESYDDFSADYRHISEGIQRSREDGSYSPSQARRYARQLQQIRSFADREQRSGQFDAQDIEGRLTQLHETMHAAREDGQGTYNRDYRR
jgi:hypothetical protein